MAERKELDRVVKLDSFPSNSHSKKKEEVDEHIHVERVTKGKIERKPQSLGQRVKAEIISENSRSVGEHLLWDILVPAIKDTIVDLVKNGVETLMYGGASPRDDRIGRNRGSSYVRYNSYYDKDRDQRYHRSSSRRSDDLDDILFDSNAEAEKVLLALIDMLDEYDFVTRGHFYELIGERTRPSDFNWGWDNLRNARVERVRNGYRIRLPREVAID